MDYSEYEVCIESILQENALNTFKKHPKYNHILEHVCDDYGYHYLRVILDFFEIPPYYVQLFGKMNDEQGNPQKTLYRELGVEISPTSLRYICHALIILSHMKSCNLSKVNVVEVGCGYGGLALAISFFCGRFQITIDEYTCIDLPGPLKLQQQYLQGASIPLQMRFESAHTFGRNLERNDYFLISNYCFSEISDDLQKKYLQILFPKCTHGFLTWNHIDVYDIGKQVTIETEYPLTGKNNKYVRF